MKINKKGFTLIELLAVIIILAVIALIAIPSALKILGKAKLKSAEDSVYGIVESVDNYVANFMLKNEGGFPNGELEFYCDGTGCKLHNQANYQQYKLEELENLKFNGIKPTDGVVTISNNGKEVIGENLVINGYICSYYDNKAKCVKYNRESDLDELKQEGSIRLSSYSKTLIYPEEETISITENISGGVVSCEEGDREIATCEISPTEDTVTIKSGRKAGLTTITIKSARTPRYKEAKAEYQVTTIGALSVTTSDYNGIYDGEEHGITVICNGAEIKYGTVEGEYTLSTSPKYINADTYTVYYEVTREGYTTVRGSKTVTINKADGNVVAPSPNTLTYTGSVHALVSAGSSGTGVVEYKLSGEEYSENIPVGTNAGTYRVYYRVIGDNNHNDVAENYVDVTIEKADSGISLSENSGEITYPTEKTITVTNPNNLDLTCESSNTSAVTCSVSGNTVTITPGTTAATNVTITISSAATTNYNGSQVTYTATNQLGTLSVTASGYSGAYDGESHVITVTSSGATIKYGTEEGTYNLDASPTRTDVGTTTVYYEVTKEGHETVAPITLSTQL